MNIYNKYIYIYIRIGGTCANWTALESRIILSWLLFTRGTHDPSIAACLIWA